MIGLAALVAIVLLVSACGPTADTDDGCKGHGGVAYLGKDATNGKVPFYCKDGTIGWTDPS